MPEPKPWPCRPFVPRLPALSPVPWIGRLILLLALLASGQPQGQAEVRFTVGTFNVENYLLQAAGTRRAKTLAARAHVAASLASAKPDILALQEIGGPGALADLQQRLRQAGLALPHSELITGADTNIHVALLSRFAIRRRSPHTNDVFLLDGRRHRVGRGFLEAELEVTPSYRLTVLVAHLKSKRTVMDGDEAELRAQEARLLRGYIDEAFQRQPDVNLLVCGDLNDTPDSRPIRWVRGTGIRSLVDARPAESAGPAEAGSTTRNRSRRVVWTHYFAQEESYSRFDYLLMSRGLAREWQPEGTRIVTGPDWGLASDHRPIVAEFLAEER
jgi:endonuclease/exonuclease/phosphatase family metal-dependent hydrolase